MPNGNPDFRDDFLNIQAFFGEISPILEAFASRHNLQIEKYYHESPSWSFLFRHPRRGVAKIDAKRESDCEIKISAAWWYDDYSLATRSMKTFSNPIMNFRSPSLADVLESTLQTVAAWQFGSWDEIHGGYGHTWRSTWTQEQFEALERKFPELHL